MNSTGSQPPKVVPNYISTGRMTIKIYKYKHWV